MEELSLAALTAQLQAAQEKKAVVRLSERNVVELVNKLKELGFLESSLLHTSNGKEYLTQAQLRKEIQETLAQSGGRVSLSEVCNRLNVDLSHCEKERAGLVEESGGSILSIQEELITEGYLHTIAVEIKERLETVGMLRIGDLVVQYGLSHDLLLSVVSSHLGSVLNGELVNSMLFTQAYMDRLKAQLRGALRGTTSPTSISAVLKQIQLEDSGTLDIIQKLIQDLMQESHIQGELRTNGQWVPDVHLKAQRSGVVSSFHQNGWVSLGDVRKVAPLETEFLSQHLSEYRVLDSVAVAPSFVETIDAEMEEQIEQGTWCDVCSLAPMEFSEEDVRLLLQESDLLKRHSNLQQITDTCFISQACLEVRFLSEEESVTWEVWDVQLAKEALFQSKQKKSKPEEESISGATKPKLEEEEEDDGAQEKGKSKKKGRAKNKGKVKQTDALKQPSKSGKDSMYMGNCPTLESLQEQLVLRYPDMEDVSSLVETLAEKLLSDVVYIYKQTIEEATKMTDKRRLDMKDKALKQVEESLNKLWLFSKGIDTLKTDLDDPTVLLLKKHLNKSTGSDGVDWLLRYFQLQEPGADEEIPDEMIPIAPNIRSKIIDQLPSDISPLATVALQNLKQDEPEVLLERLENGMESCGIRFPKRDKKAEKQKIVETRTAWKEQLNEETNPATVLALALPLLIVQLKDVLISLPGRAMPSMMEVLKPVMKAEDHETLQAFHKAVVEDLKQKSNPESIKDQQAVEETLLELIPKAKNLVT